jgi:proteasome lid subunit RPN8/RPN11
MHHLVGRRARLRVPHRLWRVMVAELARRGAGTRESGAFLLGPANDTPERVVTETVYMDDLDPRCLTGGISLSNAAFGRLWDICAERRLRVVADVHTHPTVYVCQSAIDKANPMIAMAGHIAIILPSYARGRIRLDRLGVHEYLGDAGWRQHLGRAAKKNLYVGRWA